MMNLLAYSERTCIINGLPADPSRCNVVGWWFFGIFVVMGLALLTLFVFWIVTLVHVITHEDVPNRVVWLILHLVGAPLIASPIYYFTVQKPYERTKKAKATSKKKG